MQVLAELNKCFSVYIRAKRESRRISTYVAGHYISDNLVMFDGRPEHTALGTW